MTNEQCKKAQINGQCTGACDQCNLDGHKPRKEFGMPYGYPRRRKE